MIDGDRRKRSTAMPAPINRPYMHQIETEIDIAATAQRVWSILTDFTAYPEWNPFIRSIEGVLGKGQRLKVAIQPEGARAMTFRPIVLAAVADHEFRWCGRFVLPGIFDGEHYFHMLPGAPGSVRFVQGEKFSGLLVGFAKAGLDSKTKAGFIAMNQALKARAEKAPRP
jgi:hypothetical protein